MLARGGTYSIVGYGGMVAVPSVALVASEHAVVGNLVGTWIDLWEVLQLHAAGRVVLKTEAHPLDSVNDVLDEAPRGRGHRPRRARSRVETRERPDPTRRRWTRPRCSRGAASSSSELAAACLARIRECDGVHSHDGDPGLDQRVGARLRGGCGRGGGPGRRAPERGRRAARRPAAGADRGPGGAQGSVRRRGKAGHRVEPSARGRSDGGLRRVEAAALRRGWCCSAICTRTSSQPAGRRIRSAARGPSSAPPAARAAARRRRWRPSWFPPPPAPTPRDRSASRPPAAAPRRSSRRAAGSRWRESCRCPGASTTPARWRARSPTAGCCWRRWQARIVGVPRARSTRPRRSCCPSASRRDRLRECGWPSPRALAGADLDADVARGLRARGRRLPSARRIGRRAAATRGERRRGRRLPRRPDDGVARLSPSLRRQTRALPAVARASGSRRASGVPCPVEAYVAAQARRRELTAAWAAWLDEHRLAAVVEPTIPVVAPLRGDGYEHAGTRLRADLAHAPLGLDRLPGRGPPGRRRAQRPARRRVADRPSRLRLGAALAR